MPMTPEEKRARNTELKRQWRAANPEKSRAAVRKYQLAHPEIVRKTQRKAQRKYRLAHPEKLRAYREAHREENQARWKAWEQQHFPDPEALREYQRGKDRRSYAKHREKRIAKTRIWRETHREARRAWQLAYYHTHRDEIREKRREHDREYMRVWRQANPEKRRAASKRAHAAHRDTRNAASAAYRSANPEKMSALTHAYYTKNRERLIAQRLEYSRTHLAEELERWRVKSNKRRAIKAADPRTDLTTAQWRMIKEHYAQRCVYCGAKPKRLTMDHITPLSKGGHHTLSNVVPACFSCNSRKHAGPVLKPVQPLLL